MFLLQLSELLDCLSVTLANSGLARQEIATSFAMFEAFSRLVEDSVVREHKHSIYSFVEAVNEYLPKLARSMFALVYFTPLTHEDQRHLANITQGNPLPLLAVITCTQQGTLNHKIVELGPSEL